MDKKQQAFRSITEVAKTLALPSHVLRFWETKFTQIEPVKRAGGRRYYRQKDVELICRIKSLLYEEGYTIRGAQMLLKEEKAAGKNVDSLPEEPIFQAETQSYLSHAILAELKSIREEIADILKA